MPFQWRISLLVVVALLFALLTQLAFGFWLFNRALTHDLQADLARLSLGLEQGLIKTPQGTLALEPESLAGLRGYLGYAAGRGRVLSAEGKTLLLFGGAFPKNERGWLMVRHPLEGGRQLEVAMSRRSHNQELREYLKLSLIGLPLLTALLGGIGLWVTQRLLRPLRDLERVVSEVTSSRDLKRRVAVAGANDDLASLARSFNSMMARLEAFFEREKNFTRYASHELRNPVAVLRVQVEAAQAGDLPTEQVLPTLKRELTRLSAMLGSLLILARDEPPPSRILDLAALARESVDRARVLAAEGEQLVDYRGAATCPFYGDEVLLGRLFDNLLENALNYAPAGEVLLKLERMKTGVQVCVQDEGPGVPPEQLRHLGTPFYRGAPGRAKGSGLGLSAVKHIAQVYGGSARFENLEPSGFAVSVTLTSRDPEAG